MNPNIKELGIKNCFGCAVCAKACPKQIIKTHINEFGFFEPFITSYADCIGCGICVNVCSFFNKGVALETDTLNAYAGWSNDDEIRWRCSSGGVGFELARTALSNGYKVCAVRYNNSKNIAEHFIANDIKELQFSIGSKYIQSDALAGMKHININKKYVLFGTPCHIDSYRRYLRRFKKENNFILVDFFCHGVPSYLLWNKYLEMKKSETGEIEHISWRNKKDGWHDSWVMDIKGKNGSVHTKLSDGDLFFKTFLSDSCLGKACYDNCKFKFRKSSADIRIGDAWGQLYQQNSEGVNAVICLTLQGCDLLKKSNCTVISHDFNRIAEYQMRSNAKRPVIYAAVQHLLKKEGPLDINKLKLLLRIHEIIQLPKRIKNKLIKVIQ